MEQITADLAQHQRSTESDRRSLFENFQAWVERFNSEFQLDLTDVVLRLDPLKAGLLGYHRPGRNGFSMRGEVGLNTRYVRTHKDWVALAVLLHELVHVWQWEHGYPSSRHNHEFSAKLASLGVVYRPGVLDEVPDESRFRELLTRHGIAVPPAASRESVTSPAMQALAVARAARAARRRTSGTWSCGCTTVRVVSKPRPDSQEPSRPPTELTLAALCFACGSQFKLQTAMQRDRQVQKC